MSSTLPSHLDKCSSDKGFSPLRTFGAQMPRDDSTSFLSLDVKPYRTLLAERSISIFDFRIYFFSRLWHLLVRRGQLLVAAEKASRFVHSFAQTLRQVQV